MPELTRRIEFRGGIVDGGQVVVRCDLRGDPPEHVWADAAGHVAPNDFPGGVLYVRRAQVTRLGAQVYEVV